MRIVHVYKTFFPETFGGCEKAIQSITQATRALGCENRLLTITQEATHQQRNLNDLVIDYFPSTASVASCPISISLFKHFREQVKNADIIHYHFPWPFSDFLHCFYRISQASVVTYHSDIVRQKYLKYLYHPLMMHFLKKVNAIIPTSENLIHSSEVLKKNENKCYPIPLCLDPKDYQKKDEQYYHYIHRQYGNRFILFVGVLRYYKGLHYLLKAMKHSEAHLLIAGDGPEKQRLTKLSQDLMLNNVTFLGKVNDVQKNTLLDLCQAVVLPSHLPSEAFGVSLLEGLMFGKPLLSTDLGTGTSIVNQHLKTGLLVPPSDIPALIKALDILTNDNASIKEWGREARKHYEKNFTLEKVGKAYLDIYEKILEG